MSPWTVLSALLPNFAHQLKACADTAAGDAALWAKDLRQRLLAGAVAVVGILLCLILGSAWIFAAVWNTAARNPVLGAMLCTFLVCAIVGAALATRRARPGHEPFARLRREMGAGASAQGAFPRSIVMRLLLNWTGLSRDST
jgi:hypothetical protein